MPGDKGICGDAEPAGLVSTLTSVTVSKCSLTYVSPRNPSLGRCATRRRVRPSVPPRGTVAGALFQTGSSACAEATPSTANLQKSHSGFTPNAGYTARPAAL